MVTEIEIDKEDITEVTLDGTGTFDHLMRSLKEHLLEEYTSQRIRGSDYANVYVGSIQTVMAQAIQFELGRYVAEGQANLLKQQLLTAQEETLAAQKNNELLDCQILKCAKELELMDKEIQLKDAQIINMGFQNDLIEQQVLKMIQEVLVMEQQVLTAAVQRQKLEAEVSLLGKQEDKLDQDILVAQQQVLQSIEQVKLIKQQVINLAAELDKIEADTAFVVAKTTNTAAELAILQKQVFKITEEINLLEQRVRTETAQTADDIEGTPVTGAMGRKILLYQRQADGFLRDAEQKAAKIYTDMWNISKSADPDGVPEVAVLGESTFDANGNLVTGTQTSIQNGVKDLREILETVRLRAIDPNS